jgi:RNA polymerase sigma-70 factor (ECF subfamily)
LVDAESRFRLLFREAYPALKRYVAYRGVSKADADDLVAATMEVAWRRMDQVPAEDPLPWLYGVARNLLRNHRRSLRRASTLASRLPISPPVAAPGDEEVSVDALLAALSGLGEDDQEVLLLVAWDGLSPSQAAVVLGCTPVAARSRLHRARRRLATELGLTTNLQRSGSDGHEKGCGEQTEAEVPSE